MGQILNAKVTEGGSNEHADQQSYILATFWLHATCLGIKKATEAF